jgi:murein L,D-transpeptidase YafK
MKFCATLLMALFLINTSAGFAVNVPQSNLSKQAILEAKPRLESRLKDKDLQLGQPVFIRIFKREKKLELWLQKDGRFELFHTWPIAKFSGRPGPKTKQGDRQAPEGFYFVPPNQLNPYSSYHLSFNLGYPNRYDRSYGRTGSALMVHGNRVSIGCYAMTDPVIEEIWTLMDAAYRQGQPFIRVHVFPFRMTQENMDKHGEGKWQSFWVNLKEGYDFFETKGIVPNVNVRNKRYVFD